ncbi:MAG: calcium-translocating P-type ATPase, SERCA-type [Candidatus Heimdallarchaeota archaeon]|nr:calcium-translocating P-type ATPase, SERCA-type [Candidatus Heimdallarchaeota archaeon]
MKQYWHAKSLNSVIDLLETDDERGLSSSEALKRLETYGPNELEKTKKKHPIFLFLDQFTDPLVIILLVALVISVTIGVFSPHEEDKLEYFVDAVAITVIVLFNALFGFIQEYKAEKSIEALKSMAAPFTTVVRDGKKDRIEARFLVPGDIIQIEEGDKVPADARLIQAHSLRVDESMLTGESFPVAKERNAVLPENASIADIRNTIFSGTNITRGRSLAVVIQTGMNTEFGKIAKGLMDEDTEETPLQKRLKVLGKWIGIASLSICAIIFAIGVILSQNIIDMFIVAVGLAVAAVPEGLPAVVTLALALGVQRMSQKNAIIRRLPSVETLGSTTVICSDKTGTLTRNEMTGRKILTVDEELSISSSMKINEAVEKILAVAIECNNAQLKSNDFKNEIDIGDPTEIALLRVAKKLDFSTNFERLYEIPFDSNSKRMSVVVKNPSKKYFVFTKGAPDVLLQICENYYSKGEIMPLNENVRQNLEKSEQLLAERGYRMLGMAFKEASKEKVEISIFSEDTEQIESNLTYLGAIAIMDPPREGTKESIETCKVAGIRPVMITGDHMKTALAVANEIGLVEDIDTKYSMEGSDLALLSDKELRDAVKTVRVFARVSPEHKLKLVSAFKANNHIVAMTGDGVNDAPALKKADIGISMGISGTDVSKEASDMVLADDDFSTIVGAILEGRTIYDNMRKFILYLLSCNAGEIAAMFIGIMITSILFGAPVLPLLAIQILWVNLATDGLPALALGVDPPDSDVMIRKPRDPDESILTKKAFYFILYSGILIGVGTLFIFFWYLTFSTATTEIERIMEARTAAFTLLVTFQMIMALNIRKEEHSLFGKEFIRNPYLLLAIISSMFFHSLILYLPLLNPIFETVPLSLTDWLFVLIIGSTLIFIDESRTFLSKRVPALKSIAGYW